MTTGSVAETAQGDTNTDPDEERTDASGGDVTAADGATGATSVSELSPTEAARELLVAYKTGDDPGPFLAALADLDEAALRSLQTDRETALAFWLNCYNAGTQRLLDERPARYESPLRMVRFFGARCLTVAGTGLSLDDIEHGMLRGRSKYGLGYLPRLLPDTFEVLYGLDDPDPRIHFALNCGAASCPAIRAYDPDAVTDQLDVATRVYLDSTVEYDAEAGRVRVPRVFLWYRGDFGGTAGIREFLRAYDVIPPGASPTVSHQPWDWSLATGNFVE